MQDAGGEGLGGVVEGEPSIDASEVSEPAAAPEEAPCPPEMVSVGGRFCIDRFEGSLVDDTTGQNLSPHYPPDAELASRLRDKWESARVTTGPVRARSMPVPMLPEVERSSQLRPKVIVERGTLPQGYMSGKAAEAACRRANKRLCTFDEWRTACRGERDTQFPYGSEYREGACNVYRNEHPAALLHGNASKGHSDPRLGLVQGSDGPLLRQTGSTPACVSRWGVDGVYDMVGNVDEWIDDPEGRFAGGFFSRATRDGCEASIRSHPFDYWDYSLGVRCCRDVRTAKPDP